MTPDRVLHLLAPILGRVRDEDHWLVPQGGSPIHRRTKMGASVLMNHARRIARVGACPMRRGSSTTRIALLDLDSHKGEASWAEMVAAARRLIAAAGLLGVSLIPFRSSGAKGIHLIAIWDEEQDARSVRALLADVLSICGFTNGTRGVKAGQVEIFPKQDSVPADGWGSMFVLPMAGESEPLHPVDLAVIDLEKVDWPTSGPVPVLPPVQYLPVPVGSTPALEKVRGALFAIDPNGLGYDDWVRLLFAVHAATEASEEGLALMLEWSSQWSGFDAEASASETVKQWRAAKIKPGGIGAGSLFKAARDAGWQDPEVLALTGPEGFEVVADAPPGGLLPANLSRDKGFTNVVRATMEPNAVGRRLAYDTFDATVKVLPEGETEWRPITDNDTQWIRSLLETNVFGAAPNIEDTRAAISMAADKNRMDSMIDWIEALPEWDGKARVSRFLTDYLGAANSAYNRAVSAYLWTALAGRILDPGCQADMVPVLVGAQGIGKSSAVRALVANPTAHYCSINLHATHDADQSRLLRGKVVGEIGELRGLSTRDAESIKDWVTRRQEEWTPKFKEHNVVYLRRCVFIGTTNEERFLTDPTGNRRWLPVKVTQADIAAIERDRDQLWAEAALIFRDVGVQWQEAERLGRNEHRHYMAVDEWSEAIGAYLHETGKKMSVREIAAEVLRIDLKGLDERVKKRIVAALRTNKGVVMFRGRPESGGNPTGLWKWAGEEVSVDDLL